MPKALRSDMEAPKALNGVKSGRGVENAFCHTFWSQNTSSRQKNAILAFFLIFGFWSAGGTSISLGPYPRAPP